MDRAVKEKIVALSHVANTAYAVVMYFVEMNGKGSFVDKPLREARCD